MPQTGTVSPNAASPAPTPTNVNAPSPGAFDVNGARAAGYSDDEILQHLTQSRNFDVNGAMKAGYSKQEIISHLSSKPAAYSDLPPGAQVIHDPLAPRYSDLPPGATVVSEGQLSPQQSAQIALAKKNIANYPAGEQALPTPGVHTAKPALPDSGPGFLSTIGHGLDSFGHTLFDEPGSHLLDPSFGYAPGERAPGSYGEAHPLLPGEKVVEPHTIMPSAATPIPQGNLLGTLEMSPLAPLARIINAAGSSSSRSANQVQPLIEQKRYSEAFGHGLATAIPGGSIAEDAGEAFGKGHVREGLADTTMALAPYGAGEVLPKVLKPIVGKLNPAPLAADASQYAITKAINPAAGDLGFINANGGGGAGFKGNLADVHDILANHAQQTGLPQKLAAAKTPSEAVGHVAATARDASQNLPIFKQAIEPLQNESISLWGGGTTTLGKLNNELTAINAELYPAYQRGGAGSAAAGAAVSAERVQQLQGRAAAIRNIMNDFISKRTGVPVDQVAELRGQYGKLKDIADTMQYRANEMENAENKASNRDFSEKYPVNTSATGAVLNAGGKVANKFVGNPVIKGLQQAFTYKGAPPTPLTITPAAAPRPRVPLWQQNPSPSPSTGAVPQPVADAITAQSPGKVPEIIQEITASGHTPTSDVASLEELMRGGGNLNHWRVNVRNGTLGTHLGVQPDPGPAGLRPGEAIISLSKDGKVGVASNASGLSDSEVMSKFEPLLRRTFPEKFEKKPSPAQQPPKQISDLLAPRIDVVHPNGTPGTVPAEQLSVALTKGYRLAQPLEAAAA